MWKYVGASVQGTSHLARGTPCQDVHTIGCILVETEEIFWTIVADGAGSAKHAEDGARIICDRIEERVRRWFSVSRNKLTLPSREIIIKWIKRIRKYICDIADKVGLSLRDFACTVSGIIVGGDEAICFQIGDGTIVVGDGHGEFEVVFWPENGEYANTTFFVTDNEFEQSLEFKILTQSPIEIAIFTDGLQRLALQVVSKSVHAPFFLPMFRRLAPETPGFSEGLKSQLIDFLNSTSVNQRTDDDKTLILASQLPVKAI
jgi:hypothetical protein